MKGCQGRSWGEEDASYRVQGSGKAGRRREGPQKGSGGSRTLSGLWRMGGCSGVRGFLRRGVFSPWGTPSGAADPAEGRCLGLSSS